MFRSNFKLRLDETGVVQQLKNARRLRNDVRRRYFGVPDLQHIGKNIYRCINTVSDFAAHADPLRRTANHK